MSAAGAVTQAEQDLEFEEQELEKVHRGTLLRILRLISEERRLVGAAFLLMIFGTSAALLEPRLLGFAIDDAIVPKRWDVLEMLVMAYLGIVCLRYVSIVGQSYLFEKIGQRVMLRLRTRLYEHLQSLPLTTYNREPVGKLVTRVTNDISALSDMFSMGLITIATNILIVIGIIVWLLVLDTKLGLITICVFPFLVFSSVYFSKKLRTAYRQARSRLSALNAFLSETFFGMRVLHVFGKQHLRREQLNGINESYARAQVASVRLFSFFQPAITWCVGVSIALLIWFGGIEVTRGEIEIGVLIAFFAYVASLFQPVREIADKWNVVLSGTAAAERIFAVLDWESEIPAQRTLEAANPARIQGEIVFENVWFTYGDPETADETGSWVLRDLSFRIRAGMKVGVVGHTGAGKTTLIQLLLRFYEPQRGRILLDGRDLREWSRRDLRAAFGVVQQDVFLFSGSVWDNILLWRESTRQRRAEIESSLMKLSGQAVFGMDSGPLQERGSNLSMGERQLLAFARARAADPSIWILDEATASIDSHTEDRIARALQQSVEGRTVLMIAHRLATIRDSDLILVLHKGIVAEQGTHSELIRPKGLYLKLQEVQGSPLVGE